MEGSLPQAAALIVQIAMGLSLAACAGLRAFLPLFVVGAAGKLDLLPLLRSLQPVPPVAPRRRQKSG